MKSIFCMVCLLLSSSMAHANCIDLSHKSKIGATDLEIKQIGCAQFSRQMIYQGQPYGKASVVELDGVWKTDSVNDEYESFTRQTRWTWNADSTVLVYEFIVDGADKNTGNKSLNMGTQIYKKTAEGKIAYDEYSQSRLMKPDGAVTVDQEHESELREPLH